MSLTFTVFQELKSLGSLPLAGEISQNLSSSQPPPRGKKSINLYASVFVLRVPYFTFYKLMPTFSH